MKTPNFTIICPKAIFFFLSKNRALGSWRGGTEGWRCLATDIGRNATADGIPGPAEGGVKHSTIPDLSGLVSTPVGLTDLKQASLSSWKPTQIGKIWQPGPNVI